MAKRLFLLPLLLLAGCLSLTAQTTTSLHDQLLGSWRISETDDDSQATSTYQFNADSTATLKLLLEADALDGALRMTFPMRWELTDSIISAIDLGLENVKCVYFGDNLDLRKQVNDNPQVGIILAMRLLAQCPYLEDHMKVLSVTADELTLQMIPTPDEDEDETDEASETEEAAAPEAATDGEGEEADEPKIYVFKRVQPN